MTEQQIGPKFRAQLNRNNKYFGNRHDDIVARHKRGHSPEKIANDLKSNMAVVTATIGSLKKEENNNHIPHIIRTHGEKDGRTLKGFKAVGKLGRLRVNMKEATEWKAEPLKGVKGVTHFVPRRVRGNNSMTSKERAYWAVYSAGRRAAKAAETKKEAITEHKIGDVVRPTIGPHKGHRHEIIHIFDDGKLNIRPLGLRPKQIKYRLGAATTKPENLAKEETVNELSKKTLYSYLDKNQPSNTFLRKPSRISGSDRAKQRLGGHMNVKKPWSVTTLSGQKFSGHISKVPYKGEETQIDELSPSILRGYEAGAYRATRNVRVGMKKRAKRSKGMDLANKKILAGMVGGSKLVKVPARENLVWTGAIWLPETQMVVEMNPTGSSGFMNSTTSPTKTGGKKPAAGGGAPLPPVSLKDKKKEADDVDPSDDPVKLNPKQPTPVLINPTMKQSENDVGDVRKDLDLSKGKTTTKEKTVAEMTLNKAQKVIKKFYKGKDQKPKRIHKAFRRRRLAFKDHALDEVSTSRLADYIKGANADRKKHKAIGDTKDPRWLDAKGKQWKREKYLEKATKKLARRHDRGYEEFFFFNEAKDPATPNHIKWLSGTRGFSAQQHAQAAAYHEGKAKYYEKYPSRKAPYKTLPENHRRLNKWHTDARNKLVGPADLQKIVPEETKIRATGLIDLIKKATPLIKKQAKIEAAKRRIMGTHYDTKKEEISVINCRCPGFMTAQCHLDHCPRKITEVRDNYQRIKPHARDSYGIGKGKMPASMGGNIAKSFKNPFGRQQSGRRTFMRGGALFNIRKRNLGKKINLANWFFKKLSNKGTLAEGPNVFSQLVGHSISQIFRPRAPRRPEAAKPNPQPNQSQAPRSTAPAPGPWGHRPAPHAPGVATTGPKIKQKQPASAALKTGHQSIPAYTGAKAGQPSKGSSPPTPGTPATPKVNDSIPKKQAKPLKVGKVIKMRKQDHNPKMQAAMGKVAQGGKMSRQEFLKLHNSGVLKKVKANTTGEEMNIVKKVIAEAIHKKGGGKKGIGSAGQDSEGDEHPIYVLRKALTLGASTIKHKNGEKTTVPAQVATWLLNRYAASPSIEHKERMISQLGHSKSGFEDAVNNRASPKPKKYGQAPSKLTSPGLSKLRKFK